MKVVTRFGYDNEFESENWRASSADVVISVLRKQLRAASGVFPELRDYEIWPREAPTPKPKK